MKVKLSDICLMQSGGTPKRSNLTFYNGNIPWVTISDFKNASNDIISKTEESLTENGLKAINNRIFKKGTLLLAMYGSVGKTVITGIEASTNQAILAINPKDDNILNIKFLKYWFEHNKDFIYSQGKGATLQNISLSIVKRQEIELPEKELQDKIVALLDRAKNIIEKRKLSINLLDNLLKNYFLEIFGEPTRNEKEWKIVKLSNYINKIIAGTSYGGRENTILQEDELGVLKISSVTRGFFNPNEFKAVQKSILKKEIVNPKKGDLLFSRANTMEFVGATCIVDKDYDDLFLPDKLWKLELKEEFLTKTYLHFLLQSENFRKNFTSVATGSSGSMLNISMVKFNSIKIPLPPMEKQILFENLYLLIEKNKKKSLAFINESNELLNCLFQQAFNKRLSYDIDVELEALLNNIDLRRNNSANDISTIKNDITFLQRLLDKLNGQEFDDINTYDKAKYASFRILNEEKGLVMQKLDKDSNNIKLVLK